jgi:hypothetical protein
MRRLPACSLPLVLAASLAAGFVAPRSAHGQLLKGIKKAAADAAKKKVEDKIDGKPAEAPADATPAGGSPSSAPAQRTTRDPRDTDVVITAERVDILLALYRPILPEISRQQRFFAQADSAERSRERFSACVENVKQSFDKLSQAQQTQQMMALMEKGAEESGRYQTLSTAVSRRYETARAADAASVQSAVLADSVQGLAVMSGLPMMPGGAKCGKYPFLSAAAAQSLSARLKNEGPDGQPRVVFDPAPTDAVKAAMSKEQYGKIRERIAFWALQQLGFYEGENVTIPFSPFSAEELAVLTAKKRELMPLGEAWASGTARWSRWRTLAW